MYPMFAEVTNNAPTVVQATTDVARVINDAMGVITNQPVLLAMFGMALLIPAFKVIKRARNTTK